MRIYIVFSTLNCDVVGVDTDIESAIKDGAETEGNFYIEWWNPSKRYYEERTDYIYDDKTVYELSDPVWQDGRILPQNIKWR